MSTPPRTAREALFAEMLGDLDNMLSRIEKLPELIENCETRLSASAATLESAGEKYGQAVIAFTEQAKGELADFLERESATVAERQTAIVQKALQDALLAESKNSGSNQLIGKQPFWIRLFEYAAIALLTSLFTFFWIYLAR